MVHGTGKCGYFEGKKYTDSINLSTAPGETKKNWHCECLVKPNNLNYHLSYLFALEVKKRKIHIVSKLEDKSPSDQWEEFAESLRRISPFDKYKIPVGKNMKARLHKMMEDIERRKFMSHISYTPYDKLMMELSADVARKREDKKKQGPKKRKYEGESNFLPVGISPLSPATRVVFRPETRPYMTLESAKLMAHACSIEAQKREYPAAISIVDNAANLIYFERMDNVELVRVAESQEKAMNSAKKNITLRTMDLLSEGVPGAMPVMWQGYCLGAIGISGHDPETDRMIATAGLGVINDI